MLKKELLELLKSNKDEDNIDEILGKADPVKALVNSGLTVDAFKTKVESDPNFKSFMDSEKDKHSSKSLETWKTNNLQKLVDEEYYKRHPDDKPKDPLLAKALEDAKNANERAERLEKENLRKDLINKAIKNMDEKKLHDFNSLVDCFIGTDEDVTKKNIETLTSVLSKHDEALKTEILKDTYKPGGKGGSETTEEAVQAQVNSIFGIK